MAECNFDYKFDTATFDSGSGANIRLSSVLKYQENAGEVHLADDYGYDYDHIMKHGNVFVLTNTIMKINRMPMPSESLTIHTWNKNVKGFKFFRAYDWIDESGEKVIESVSAFVLVSASEHKIVRADALGFELPCESETLAGVPDPVKIKLPKEMERVGSKKILFSMLDRNEHLNNALYADFLVDFVEPEQAKGVCKAEIDYVKEASLGDVVEVYRAQEGNTVYLKGVRQSDDTIIFRGSLSFR